MLRECTKQNWRLSTNKWVHFWTEMQKEIRWGCVKMYCLQSSKAETFKMLRRTRGKQGEAKDPAMTNR